MSTEAGIAELIRKRILALRPHAKFISVSDSGDFVPSEAALVTHFFAAYLYDERIDANFLITKLGPVLLLNGYLSSFAYNVVLCWLYTQRKSLPELEAHRLLKYNFRKFFAEQLYRANNCIRSRELLLRTLLFEQADMEPVFADYRADTGLSDLASSASGLMDHILTMHELGHYFLKSYPTMWEQMIGAPGLDIQDAVARLLATCPAELVPEFQSDVYAVMGCLLAFEKELGSLFVLRGLVFGYAAYAVMYSAASTAANTAANWPSGELEEVDFSDISLLPDDDLVPNWKFDSAFLCRAHLVRDLCVELAARKNLTLFGSDGPFPLPTGIVDALMQHLGSVLDSDSETSVRIARLVARSLHGHERGMEYLYLRSKTFRSARPDPLMVNPTR